jgi:hypothetical protein
VAAPFEAQRKDNWQNGESIDKKSTMKSKGLVVGIAMVLTLAAVERAASALMVVNGGFETGDTTVWTVTFAASGSMLGVATTSPNSGTYSALFGAWNSQYDSIAQNLATTAGQQYTLSFFLRNNGVGNDSFQALWDGTAVLDITPSTSEFDYTQFNFNVTATAASTPLEFRAYDNPALLLLDDVSVTAVPEPPTLLLLALGGLALLRRRR